MTLWIALVGILSLGGVGSTAKASEAGVPHEWTGQLDAPEPGQSVLSNTLLILQQRVRAAGEESIQPVVQSMLTLGEGEYQLIVRGTTVPDLFTRAIPLNRMFGFAPRIDGGNGPPPAAGEDEEWPALPTPEGNWIRIGPFAPLDERQVEAVVPSVLPDGSPGLRIRFETSAQLRVDLAYRVLKGRTPVMVFGGLAVALPDDALRPETAELYVTLAGNLEELAAATGLVRLGEKPLPSEVTLKVSSSRTYPRSGGAPSLTARLKNHPAPDVETFRKIRSNGTDLTNVILLSRALSGGASLPRDLGVELLSGPSPALAALPFLLPGGDFSTGFLVGRATDPRPQVQDAVRSHVLAVGRSDRTEEVLESLATTDVIARWAPHLARKKITSARSAIETYIKDVSRPYPSRKCAAFLLARLAPTSSLVQAIYQREQSSVYPAVVLGLAGISPRVAASRLKRIAMDDDYADEDRLLAAVLLYQRDTGAGTWLMKWLGRRKDRSLSREAKAVSKILTFEHGG